MRLWYRLKDEGQGSKQLMWDASEIPMAWEEWMMKLMKMCIIDLVYQVKIKELNVEWLMGSSAAS